jgi:hypothetical protein
MWRFEYNSIVGESVRIGVWLAGSTEMKKLLFGAEQFLNS